MENSSSISHKNNCFDLLRLLAASMVIFFHQNMFLGGGFVTDPSDWYPMDSIWVIMFISLSGFLVTMSFTRSSNFMEFIGKRIKRLFPALIFCNFIVLYLVAPFWQESAFSYIFSSSTFNSFLQMSTLFSTGTKVPHLWTDYGWLPAANAPIWTLAHEFFLYLLAGIAFSFSKTWKAPAILFVIFMIAQIFFHEQLLPVIFYSMKMYHFVELGSNFALGSLMYMTMHTWNNRNCKIAISLISFIILFMMRQEYGAPIICRLAITALTIIIGVSFRDLILKGKFDISYGMYIWAFPVQAICINVFHLRFYNGIVIVFTLTILMAIFSRKYIEQPFMKKKSQAGNLARKIQTE